MPTRRHGTFDRLHAPFVPSWWTGRPWPTCARTATVKSVPLARKASHARIRTTSFGNTHPGSDQQRRILAAAELGSGLIELDRAECLELLAAKSVGRIAYVGDTGPRILPVNYI